MSTEPYRVEYHPGRLPDTLPSYMVIDVIGRVQSTYSADPAEPNSFVGAHSRATEKAKALNAADKQVINKRPGEPADEMLDWINDMKPGDLFTITRDAEGRFIIFTAVNATSFADWALGDTINEAWEKNA